MLKLALFSLFTLFVLVTGKYNLNGNSNGKACPKVPKEIFCKCAAIELCVNDKNCTKGQKCCLNCCGSHYCTDPVDEEMKCNKPHEEYNSCGSHCPPTCENRTPGPCILSCNPGCYCKKGYLKNKNGRCVSIDKC